MQCIKTGCHVYVDPYGEYVYGDAYDANGVLVLRIAGRTHEPGAFGPNIHFTVHNADHWFDEREKNMQARNSTMLVMPHQFVNHGYEGVPING